MSPLRRLLAKALLTLGVAGAATAQDAAELRARASLTDASTAQVGATIKLEVEVTTTTWFTQPPKLPPLDLKGILVTPPSGQGEIVRSTEGAKTYNGLRYTYLLSPTVQGRVEIPEMEVSAQIGPGKTELTARTAPLSLEVAPGKGNGSATEVAGADVSVTQAYTLAPDPLVVGGRVTRSVTQRADGVEPMLIPAAPLADVPGFTRYMREPEITVLNDGRGAFLGGQRIDRADYIATQAGEATFPTISVPWIDKSGNPRRRDLDGRTLTVQPAPVTAPPFSLSDDLAQLRQGLRWFVPLHWIAWTSIALGALVVLWFGRPWLARGWRRAGVWARSRLARYRMSERWHWKAWKREAHRDEAGLTAFYRWLAVATGSATLRFAVTPLGPAERAAGEDLLNRLYGDAQPDCATARSALLAASRSWRREWRPRRKRGGASGLRSKLNPALASGTEVSEKGKP
ncbi:hypothetical protein CEK29_12630 [Bordetella genomosp. 5]|uniref:BatD family protein n=1 Tax=Bordetella genomosp. 5 TaxID=1395608 RepID=UPI000B9E3C61|nr:BatD family protein [Bordetella genomosp. 5]OZI42584.1 hypothetical protein CEK29_12630 [Bordetella genomosp. 5]